MVLNASHTVFLKSSNNPTKCILSFIIPTFQMKKNDESDPGRLFPGNELSAMTGRDVPALPQMLPSATQACHHEHKHCHPPTHIHLCFLSRPRKHNCSPMSGPRWQHPTLPPPLCICWLQASDSPSCPQGPQNRTPSQKGTQ